MLDDHPTLYDQLERIALVERKARQIVSCSPPNVFAVHGDWGAGKTSFLRMLRFHLDGTKENVLGQLHPDLKPSIFKDDVVTVWFDAWRYQNEASPIVALLHEIRRELSLRHRLLSKGRKIGDVSVRTILNSFGGIEGIIRGESTVSASAIERTGEKWERQNFDSILEADSLHSFLSEAVQAVLLTRYLCI